MADTTNTIITGLGNSVPKWATEDTLSEMNESILKIVQAIDSKSKTKKMMLDGTNKNLSEFEKKLSELNKEQADEQKKVKKYRKDYKDSMKDATDQLERIKSSAKSGQGAFDTLSEITSGIGNLFKSLETPTGIVGGALAVAGFALGEFVEYLKNTTQAMIGLYDNGQTFAGGLGELRIAAAYAAEPLDDFGKALVKNGALVKSFGNGGAVEYAKILKQTRDLTRQNGYYGLSIAQLNEYTGDYLEFLRKQGNSERWLQEQGAQASNQYIKELTAYSQILGKSREEIDKQMKSSLEDPEVKAAMLAMTDEQRTAFTKTAAQISSIFGPDFQKQFNEAALTPYGPATELSKALSTVSPQLNNLYLNMAKMSAQGKDITPQLQEFGKGIENLSDDQKNYLRTLVTNRSSLSEGSNILVNAIDALRGNEKNLVNLNENMAKAPDAFTKSMTEIVNTFGEIKAKFAGLFAEFVEKHQSFLNDIVTNLSKAAQWILDTIQSFMDPKTRQQAIDGLVSGIKSMIDKILDMITSYISQKLGFGETGNGKILGQSYQNGDDYMNKRGVFGAAWDATKIGVGGIGSGLAETPGAIGTAVGEGYREVADWWNGSSTKSYATPKITTPAIPTVKSSPANTSQSITSDPTALLSKSVDAQTMSNDIASQQTNILMKIDKTLGDISRNTKNSGNIVQ